MVNKPHQGLLTSLGPPKVSQFFRHYFAETVLISAVFYLVLFGLLVTTELTVPTPELVFVALVPFLVLLISSGRIQEFRFGDLSMKFQQAVQGGISPSITSENFDIVEEDMTEKRGEGALEEMIDRQGSTLVFTIGGGYSSTYIHRYLRRNLEENPEFRYVLFEDQVGQFRGFMEGADFVAYVWLQDTENGGIEGAIRNGLVLDADSLVTDRIYDGSTLGEARQKLAAADGDSLAVVNTDDEFIGVLTRENVTNQLLTGVMGNLMG